MSTENPAPTPTPTPAPPAEGTPTPTPPATEAPAQEPDWKVEARKWEARAKENKSAAEKLAELEEAQKTEAQKLADRAAKAEAKAAEYERKEQVSKWKDEVSEETGVPAKALAGSTLEEIQAHAETLKPLITPAAEPPRKGAIGPYVPNEGTGGKPPALNSDALEDALRNKLGIS